MELKSKNIHFRLVEPEDAGFIMSLRIDDRYNKHLSVVDADIAKQKQWIINYKEKEQAGEEFYYIIHRNSDDLPIGTVRMYDFLPDEKSFCWGSWILNENKPKYAALESVLLIYDRAFFTMGFRRCHMDVRKKNTRVVDFHKRFGVQFIGETELDYIGHYFYEDYVKVRDSIIEVINAD